MKKTVSASTGDAILKLYSCYFVVVVSEDSLGLKLLRPPSSLQFDVLPIHDSCDSVNISADGHLICATRKDIEVKNRDTLDTTSVVRHTQTTWWGELIQSEEVVVASCYNVEQKSVEVALLDPSTLRKSHSVYKHSADKVIYYRIAQHLSVVYIVDRRENQLVVCNLADNKKKKLPVPGIKFPLPVCVLPDSTLLIGDFTEDGAVSRYRSENTTLTLMWDFGHISKPTGISFDPTSELIHICTALGPLFILSLEGK